MVFIFSMQRGKARCYSIGKCWLFVGTYGFCHALFIRKCRSFIVKWCFFIALGCSWANAVVYFSNMMVLQRDMLDSHWMLVVHMLYVGMRVFITSKWKQHNKTGLSNWTHAHLPVKPLMCLWLSLMCLFHCLYEIVAQVSSSVDDLFDFLYKKSVVLYKKFSLSVCSVIITCVLIVSFVPCFFSSLFSSVCCLAWPRQSNLEKTEKVPPELTKTYVFFACCLGFV